VPAVAKEVTSVATPELSVPVPSEVVPDLKVTVPVAVAGETVAVSVTLAPTVGVVVDAASAVVVEINVELQATPLRANDVGIALVTLFQVPLNPIPVRVAPAAMLPL
jgi:hypothetical protein